MSIFCLIDSLDLKTPSSPKSGFIWIYPSGNLFLIHMPDLDFSWETLWINLQKKSWPYQVSWDYFKVPSNPNLHDFQGNGWKGKRGRCMGYPQAKMVSVKWWLFAHWCCQNMLIPKLSSLRLHRLQPWLHKLSLAQEGPWWPRKYQCRDWKFGSLPWRILVNTFVSLSLTVGKYTNYLWNFFPTPSFYVECERHTQ